MSRPRAGLLAGFRRDTRGTAAVEFAVVTPLLALILAGSVDFGNAIHHQFLLTNAVSAASNYALQNGDRVDAASGASLANHLTGLLRDSYRVADATIHVVVNNGPAVTMAGGSASSSGTASRADSCYCPTVAAGAVAWGSATTCASACPSGASAGRFVEISLARPYEPLFPAIDVGLFNSTLRQSAMVQVR